MARRPASLVLGLLLITSAAKANRCEQLAVTTCQSAPNGPQGRFYDETGYTLHFHKDREIARLVLLHTDIIKEKVKSYVDILESQKDWKRIFPYLPPGVRTACTKTPARCREKLEPQVVELMKFDLSAGIVNTRIFDSAHLGLLNANDDDYGRARNDAQNAILKASDKAMEKRLTEEIFPLISERIGRVLRSILPDSPEREAMIARVAAVRYGGDLCRPLIFGGPSVISIAQIGAVYDPDQNSVRICRGFLGANTSLYPLYNTIAHEMTHSIDPCALLLLKPDQPTARSLRERDERSPWASVISCLRDRRSTGARNLAATLEPAQCTSDQIGEAVADFVATEVMALLIEEGVLGPRDRAPQKMEAGIANIWRTTCRATYLGNNDPHQSPQTRMERLTAVHPVIRSALGCGALPKNRLYCGQQPKK